MIPSSSLKRLFPSDNIRWETTLKLVQSSVSSPCINSFRSKAGTRGGAGIVTGEKKIKKIKTMYARSHRDTRAGKHNTPPPTPVPWRLPFVDLIEYRIKTRRFLKNGVSQTPLSTSHRGRQHKKKGKAKLSLSPRSAWSCLNKSRRSPPEKISISLGRRRPCADPCGVAGKMASCKKFIRGYGRLTRVFSLAALKLSCSTWG